MSATPTKVPTDAETHCPTCGAAADRWQLICLECGSRIALGYRRPPSWRVPVAIVSLVVLAAAAGLYFGLRALEDDADKEVAGQPVPRVEEPTLGEGEDDGGARTERGEREGEGEAQRGESSQGGEGEAGEGEAQRGEGGRDGAEAEGEQPARGGGGLPRGAGGVRSWPARRDAFTVVILSAEDRPSAQAFARSANQAGVPAGVLRADDYPALAASTGFFIVFVGSYPNQAGADREATRLSRRFPGAFPQFVDGSKSRRRP